MQAPFEQPFAYGIYKDKYAHPGEEWADTAKRVAAHVVGALTDDELTRARVERRIREREFLPGGRYLYASGRGLHQTQNCLLLRAEDTREGWSELSQKATMALMTGAGIGVEYSDVRMSGSIISRTGGVASGPIALMKMINEIGRNVMQGGSRRSAIWAGLNWQHGDIEKFVRVKDWAPQVRALKEEDFNFPADLDMTNVSVGLDREFFEAIEDPNHPNNELAERVYWKVIDKMLTTAEPGFAVDYNNPRENLRNACTEVVSADDSDVCNLGSLNMARFDNVDEFLSAARDQVLFLMAGTVYSDLPYERVHEVRERNRRLGAGLLGVHEWLLKRGKQYGPDDELASWLALWEEVTDEAAAEYAWQYDLSEPIAKRAIAPTGTIGIIAESTTGIEPIFCAAYKRRVRNADHAGDKWQYELVVDPTAKRLIDQGVDPNTIEDAYTLSLDAERRVEFQAWMQQFVDQGISSTVNLPQPIVNKQEQRAYGEMLLKHLPKLRGLTVYPDGARGGQPLSPVDVEYALKNPGVRFEESDERCVGGVCGA